MAKGVFTVKETEVPEPIPVGMYNAKLKSWEQEDGGQYGPYVRLIFEITDGEHAGTERNLIASAKVSKGKTKKTTSKLFRTITGISGSDPKPEETVSLDDLVDKECQILVEDRPDDEEGWQDITKVMPIKKE